MVGPEQSPCTVVKAGDSAPLEVAPSGTGVAAPTLPTLPARRVNARGAARREALIDAAVRLFSERGFRGTGIIGLAREVGVTHAGLLHHFGTKEQLLRSVVATRDEQYAEMVRSVSSRRGIDAIAAVSTLGPLIANEPVLSRLFTVLIAENLQPDDPLHPTFQARYRDLRSHFEQAVRDGQEDGTIRRDAVPELVAAEVVGVLLGIQTEQLLDAGRIDLVATLDAYAGGLTERLAAHPSPAKASVVAAQA